MRRFAAWMAVAVAVSVAAIVLVLGGAEERSDEPGPVVRRSRPRRHAPPSGVHTSALLPPDAGAGVDEATTEGCVPVDVIGTDGRPSPRARVSLEGWAGDELDPSTPLVHRAELHADDAGVVSICAPAGWVSLDARDSQGGWARDVMRWPPARRASIRILEPMRVRGTVRDERGSPIPGAELHLVPLRSFAGSDPRPQRDTMATHRLTGELAWWSDAEGRFAIPVGTQTLVGVSVFASGFVPAVRSPLAVRLGETTEVSFTLRDAGSICGTVRSEGEPIADIAVGVTSGATARTDEAGRFCLDGVDPEELHLVWVRAPGWLSQRLRLLAGEYDIEVQRSAQLRIRARVPDAAARCTRPRRADLSISISPVDGEEWTRALHTRVDRPAILDMEPGRVRVSAAVHGYGASRALTLRAGVTTAIELMLSLEPDSAVLELVTDDSHIAPDVIIEQERLWIRERLLDGHGCVGLQPGRYQVRFAGAHDGTSVVLGRAEHLRLVLTAPPRREAPTPPARARCHLPLSAMRVGDEVWVEHAHPDRTSLRPGDRLIRVDAIEGDGDALLEELERARHRQVQLAATRPDGSTLHEVVRPTCE